MAGRGNIRLSVGRVRQTRAMHPSEGGYIQAMNAQMEVIQQNLRTAIEEVENALPEALVYGLQKIFDMSQDLVPVDTGRLKRSGFLVGSKTAAGATVSMGYGRGGRPFYAVFVHERLDLRHRAPTQAKFLEEAVNRGIGDFNARVRQYMLLHTWVGRA